MKEKHYRDGEILRNKKSGKPYLIILHNPTCLIILDIEHEEDPAPIYALLPRDFRNYYRDIEMNCYTVKRYSYWMDARNIFTLAPQIRLV